MRGQKKVKGGKPMSIRYLEAVMSQLSNIVYNSQWDSTSKEDIIKSLKGIIRDYEDAKSGK